MKQVGTAGREDSLVDPPELLMRQENNLPRVGERKLTWADSIAYLVIALVLLYAAFFVDVRP